MCLGSITYQFQPGAGGRLRNSGEIDMTGDVLQTREIKRIVMSTMSIMAHQGAVITLWMIVLAAPETIVDQQNQPIFEDASEAVHEMPCGKADFADVFAGILTGTGVFSVGIDLWIQPACGFEKLFSFPFRAFCKRTLTPSEFIILYGHAAFEQIRAAPGDQMHGH